MDCFYLLNLFSTQTYVFFKPSSSVTTSFQPNISLALVVTGERLIGPIGLEVSYLIFKLLPDIFTIFSASVPIEISLSEPIFTTTGGKEAFSSSLRRAFTQSET